MKAVITIEIECPDAVVTDCDFEEWIRTNVLQEEDAMSDDNPLKGIQFSFFDQAKILKTEYDYDE